MKCKNCPLFAESVYCLKLKRMVLLWPPPTMDQLTPPSIISSMLGRRATSLTPNTAIDAACCAVLDLAWYQTLSED